VRGRNLPCGHLCRAKGAGIRGAHHTMSQETVENLAAQGELPLTPKEAEVVGLLVNRRGKPLRHCGLPTWP
jgi:DNA-binding response OmpR family regulator